MAREIAKISAILVTGYDCIGINIQMQQGDVKKSEFFPYVLPEDYNVMAEAIEATGQFTCTGFSPVFRDKTVKEGTTPIVEGTTEKIKWTNIILQRTVKIGENDVKVASLYVLFPLPNTEASQDLVKAKFINQNVGGALVKDVKVNLLGGVGTA